jgi:hypothetical protein
MSFQEKKHNLGLALPKLAHLPHISSMKMDFANSPNFIQIDSFLFSRDFLAYACSTPSIQ